MLDLRVTRTISYIYCRILGFLEWSLFQQAGLDLVNIQR